MREQNPPREDEYNQDIPVEIVAPAAGLVTTSPLPQAVRLRLLAPESSWSALTPAKFRASINLADLPEGFSDVPIEVAVSDPNIAIVSQTPNAVSVNLESIKTITLPVQIDLLDAPPLGYFNRSPIANPAQANIAGPASLVDQADKAVVEVFIRNSKETVQTVRTIAIRSRLDQSITGLTVEPPEVQVTVPIEQQFGYKDVSVRVRIEGQVAPGYRVSNISVDPQTLTVVGNPEVLGEIGGFVETAPINLSQAVENIVRMAPLNLPDGVTTVLPEQEGEGLSGVEITVEVTPIEDSIILQRPVSQQGITPGYWWQASPNQTDVFLSGPVSRLRNLQAGDIEVIVNLFGLEPGVYQLQPTIFKPDGLRVDAVLPDIIEVRIGRTILRSVTQIGLAPTLSWRASPSRIEVQLSGSVQQLQSLQMSDVRALLDLTDLVSGVHQIRPVVVLPDGIELEATVPDIVEVTIQPRTAITRTATAEATLVPQLEE